MKGIIFDVRRFAVHDGAGLRTTVFMKGCPLRCAWCQNPEGIELEPRPIRMEKSCLGCGLCVELSQNGGMTAEGGKITLHREREEDWAQLIDECPGAALRMDARAWSEDELIAELKKDAVFFKRGGGVTFSGGEPLMQAKFLARVMARLKSEGFHLAIETSLCVPRENLLAVLPYLDFIYADLKLFDEARHRAATGVGNKLIKENLAYLLETLPPEKLTVRTPLIPRFTADAENIAAIASFLSGKNPAVRYEMLNYNPLASAKYHLVGKEFCFEENPRPFSEEEMKKFYEVARANGVKNLVREV